MKKLLILLIALLPACSVGMAMHGKDDPDFRAIKVGSSRGAVEMQLGRPVKTALIDGKRIDTYEYEIGNKPSAGRAIGHGVMDVLTLGLWEIIGTPIEGFQGKKYKVSITYDKDDKVSRID